MALPPPGGRPAPPPSPAPGRPEPPEPGRPGPAAASSGEEALRLLGEEIFDLVLLDVMMPRLSGCEVCRALRETHPIAELPVPFL
ncbi:MAG: response regulator, partial [Actinomycetia bacterium]|nr:response regulator [Actinomycetes bacterium]